MIPCLLTKSDGSLQSLDWSLRFAARSEPGPKKNTGSLLGLLLEVLDLKIG